MAKPSVRARRGHVLPRRPGKRHTLNGAGAMSAVGRKRSLDPGRKQDIGVQGSQATSGPPGMLRMIALRQRLNRDQTNAFHCVRCRRHGQRFGCRLGPDLTSRGTAEPWRSRLSSVWSRAPVGPPRGKRIYRGYLTRLLVAVFSRSIAMLATIGVAFAAFVSTNIDNGVVLLAFFAERRVRPRDIAIGQYLGIGVLIVAALALSVLARTIPAFNYPQSDPLRSRCRA